MAFKPQLQVIELSLFLRLDVLNTFLSYTIKNTNCYLYLFSVPSVNCGIYIAFILD